MSGEEVREEYSKLVVDTVGEKWSSEADGVKKWETVRGCMQQAAEKLLGWETRRQPDWFQENITILQQLIQKRNALFARWLKTKHHSDRQRYMAQRREVACEVRRAKNAWFQQKEHEVEGAKLKGGHGRGL